MGSCEELAQEQQEAHPLLEKEGFSPKKAEEFLPTGPQVVTVPSPFMFPALARCLLPLGGSQHFILLFVFILLFISSFLVKVLG